MLTHVVLLKFTSDTSDDHLDALVESLRGLPALIPEIRRYTVSRDVGLAQGNADVSVIAHFDDADGWQTYTDHPDHRRIITEQILPRLESRSATQFVS